VRQHGPNQFPSQLPVGFWLATHFWEVVNFGVAVLGIYLALKGIRAIKNAKIIGATSRRNVMLQMAASEVGSLRNQVGILRTHVSFRSWEVSQHISGELASRLHEAKTTYGEIRGLNRDRLEVAARSASDMSQYLSSTTDGEDDKVQRLQSSCDYLGVLLNDVYGTLKLKAHEETIL
jgi:hypothetical protein